VSRAATASRRRALRFLRQSFDFGLAHRLLHLAPRSTTKGKARPGPEKEKREMRKVVIVAMALLLVFGVAGAWADQIRGKVQKIEAADRMVVLEDGTQLWLAEGLAVDTLKEGSSIKASYEERDGKKVITSVEVSE
jgi:hypothetical protein